MLQEVTNIPSNVEFIGVFCTIPERHRGAFNNSRNSTSKQLIDAFAFIPDREGRIRSHLASAKSNDDKLNVVILGLDSVSNMNFKRVFPKTRKFLMENLNAISMEGYVKIGGINFSSRCDQLCLVDRIY